MNGPAGLFVTGTDTGVGKTRAAAAVARALVGRGLRVGVLKAVATGAGPEGEEAEPGDAAILAGAVGGDLDLDRVAPIRFAEPLAPTVAARRAGGPLEFAAVLQTLGEAVRWWSDRVDWLVVEGVGGLLCPLAEGATVADLAVAMDFPLLVVARRGLGTLNHTLLTVEAARHRDLRVCGVVLNGPDPARHPLAEATAGEELSRRLGPIPILAEVAHGRGPDALDAGLRGVDWPGLMARPRLGLDLSA